MLLLPLSGNMKDLPGCIGEIVLAKSGSKKVRGRIKYKDNSIAGLNLHVETRKVVFFCGY